MKTLNKTTRNVLLTGTLSGMRTNAGLFFTALLIRQSTMNRFSSSRLIRFFYNKKAATVLAVSGVGELVADKLPTTPARIGSRGLPARIAAGAISGAVIYKTSGKKQLHGAIAGGLIAMASTFAFYYLRRNVGEAAGIPDPFIGAAEDALAIAGGIALLQNN